MVFGADFGLKIIANVNCSAWASEQPRTISQRRANNVSFTLGDWMGQLAAAHLPTRFLRLVNCNTTEAQRKRRRWADGRPTSL